MKLEVGKTYVLNNGEKHVCEVGCRSGFAMGIYWYNEDGRCGTYDADEPLSVSHEYVEGKTMAELDVKAGDVVECVTNDVVDFVGDICTIDELGSAVSRSGKYNPTFDKTYNRTYRIVSRAPTQPTLWRDMKDAEKGALLLAKHEGKSYEMMIGGEWFEGHGIFATNVAYRIKPTPKVEAVTMYGNGLSFGAHHEPFSYDTHRIMYTTTDGKPDTTSIRMEEL